MNECGVEGVWLDGDCYYRLDGESSLIIHAGAEISRKGERESCSDLRAEQPSHTEGTASAKALRQEYSWWV